MKEPFEQILEKNYPAGLHKKVMRRAWFFKYRKIFFAGAAAVLIHFLFSTWRLWSVLIETEFLGTVRALTQDIEMDFDLFQDAAKNIISLAPIAQMLDFGVSLALVAYLAVKLSKNYNLLKKI